MSQYLLPRELGGYWAEGEPLDDGTVRLTMAEPLDGVIVLPASWLTELPDPPPVDAFVLVGKAEGGDPTDLLERYDPLPDKPWVHRYRSALGAAEPLRSWPEVVKAYPYRRILVALVPLTQAKVADLFGVPEHLLHGTRPS